MKILVINAGSSSIKYSLLAVSNQQSLLTGLIERIGEAQARHRFCVTGETAVVRESSIANHQQALQAVFATLDATGVLAGDKLFAIGHRVVHGGEQFCQPALIDPTVIRQIRDMIPLAPLHNPANLLGIEESLRQMPDVPQVAVFDTAFHQTLPEHAYRYAIPVNLYNEYGVRRYGFHGTSHSYVARQAALLLGKPLTETNLITLHLGNGASASAIANGQSIDTSMGMTPLEGLIMGTRCGDIDPALHFYLARRLNLSLDDIENLLNKSSGCKGICGENDMRTIHQNAADGDASAQLALNMYAYRIKKYIGAYLAVLGRADALVFTGGIGENDAWTRQSCCEGLEGLGIVLDSASNQSPARPVATISSSDSKIAVLVIATNEELEIAMQTHVCINALP